MAVGVDVGMISFVMMGLMGLGSSMMAVPPGERDAAYLQCAPADALVYVEWASRGSGEPGADGIDGLVADPEFVTFISDVKSAIQAMVEKNSPASAGPSLKHGFPVVLEVMNRSGCLYLNYAPPDGVTEPVSEEEWMKAAQGVSVTLIIDGGNTADETEQHLLALLSSIPGAPGGQKKLDHFSIPLPIPEAEVVVHREGDHFIVAYGDGVLERAQAGLKGDVEGLGASDTYQNNLKLVDMERIGTVSWFNLARIREEGLQVAGPWGDIAGVMMTQLGVDRVNGCLSVSGIIDGQIATRTYVETGTEQEGLLTLFSGRGLTATDFQHIPKDCDFLTSFTLDLPLIRTTTKALLQDIEPRLAENFDSIETQLADEIGFSIEDDLLAAFGQQVTMFDSPSAGGLLFSSLTAAIEVKDSEKAEMVFGQLMGLLKASLPGDQSNEYSRRGVFLEEREFMGYKLYFVNTIGDDVPVSPAFCLTERAMLVSPHPLALKAHLRFLEDGGPSYAERFPTDTLPEGAVISYGSFSAEKLVEMLYAFVPYLGQMGLSEVQKSGFDLDIFSVPSAKSILPYMKESRGWVVRTEQGLLFESRSSLPTSMLSGLPMNFLIMMPARIRAGARPLPPRVIIN